MSSASEVVRSGWASVKEDAFASLFWNRKFLQLKEHVLTFHKNEVCVAFCFFNRTNKGLIVLKPCS